MNSIKLYRRRFIPDEKVFLKDDEIVFADKSKIITRWETLKKRDDFAKGVSCYFLNYGIKLSKFIDKDDKLLYWYCDIIDWIYDERENSYTFNDLLVDVIVYPDGMVKVVDLAEISEAITKGLIDIETVKQALNTTDGLLNLIYDGRFETLQKELVSID